MIGRKLDSAWTGKAFFVAAAVSLMLVGDHNVNAEPEQIVVNSVQYRVIDAQPAALPSVVSRNQAANAPRQQSWTF